MENQTDRPLSEDIAEQRREVQVEVDTNIRLRSELDASNKRLASMDEQIKAGSDDARAVIGNYLAQYLNPTQPNPAPIAPEVAAEAPAVEPPVFTTIDSTALDGGSTSGGAAVVAPEFALPEYGGDFVAPEAEAVSGEQAAAVEGEAPPVDGAAQGEAPQGN